MSEQTQVLSQETDFEIDILMLIRLLLINWWKILISVFVVATFATVYAYTQLEDEYTASSSMIVQVQNTLDSDYTNLLTGQRLVDTYEEIAKSERVLQEVSYGLYDSLGFSLSTSELRGLVNVTSVQDTLIIRVSVVSSNPTLSKAVANEIISIVQDLSREYEGLDTVEVLDEALMPINPSGPNRLLYVIIGVLLGGIAGVGIIFALEFLNQSIKTPREIETFLDLHYLGSVSMYETEEIGDPDNPYHLVVEEAPHSTVSEQYRIIKTNVDYTNVDENAKVICITSTFPREGKTLTALNIASVYKQAGEKVILVDFDLRKPKVHRSFKLKNENGVAAYLQDTENLKKYIISTETGLDILNSGPKVPFPVEILGSEKIKKLIQILREEYDRVIIDTPPLSAVADAMIVSHLSDGVVYVVASRQTNRQVAKNMVRDLKSTNAKIIGSALTMVDKKDRYYSNYYYYYYYGHNKD
jgi:succinoglycan biosynthesis transport protein ExoP